MVRGPDTRKVVVRESLGQQLVEFIQIPQVVQPKDLPTKGKSLSNQLDVN